MKRNSGFTLIEVMIVVAIVAIVATVAVPSYMGYVTKTRRAEAMTMLSEVASEQYRYFSENNAYADKMTTLGYSADNEPTENGMYTVSVTAQTANTYTLTAAPVVGKSQAGDAVCGSLTLNSVGAKGETGTGTLADCW